MSNKESSDKRLTAPAARRNQVPILEVIQRFVPEKGLIVEVASGTGEHAVFFARNFPTIFWQPTDIEPRSLESISAWKDEAKLHNLHPPKYLNVLEQPEREEEFHLIDMLVCINMIHISPWESTLGLMQFAGQSLAHGGFLFLYGPYKFNGRHTAPSNEAFDLSLKNRNPSWGVRDLEDVKEVAKSHHLDFMEHFSMPANNYSVVFKKM